MENFKDICKEFGGETLDLFDNNELFVEALIHKCKEQNDEIERLREELRKYKKLVKKIAYDVANFIDENVVTKDDYNEQLKDERWKKLRYDVFSRYGKECVLCGKKTKLQVHHLKYIKGRKAWEYDVSDLIPLCKDCHEKVHKDKNHHFYPKFLG